MSLQIRPTFDLDLTEPCWSVAERLREGLAAQAVWVRWARVPGAREEKSCENNFVLIAVQEKEQRFWSPWLQISISPNETGTHVFGRFSPRPALWTAFALSYLFLACVTFFSLVGAVSQMMVRQSPWLFYVTLSSSILMLLLWLVSQTGKHLADKQMIRLRTAVNAACHELEAAN